MARKTLSSLVDSSSILFFMSLFSSYMRSFQDLISSMLLDCFLFSLLLRLIAFWASNKAFSHSETLAYMVSSQSAI